jgi:hypothetical protein
MNQIVLVLIAAAIPAFGSRVFSVTYRDIPEKINASVSGDFFQRNAWSRHLQLSSGVYEESTGRVEVVWKDAKLGFDGDVEYLELPLKSGMKKTVILQDRGPGYELIEEKSTLVLVPNPMKIVGPHKMLREIIDAGNNDRSIACFIEPYLGMIVKGLRLVQVDLKPGPLYVFEYHPVATKCKINVEGARR